jgi:nicotinamidase-related amidase
VSALTLNPDTTVHVAIDMQKMFAEDTEWHCASLGGLVANIAAIASALPGRTFFARFRVPRRAEDAKGNWRNYYERWHRFTGAVMDPRLIDIVDSLASYATPDTFIDKVTYSVLEADGCERRFAALNADTVIFTGIETDVCVLASVMTAIDRGYRVIAVADGLGSSSAAGHEATLRDVLTRLPDQVEVADTAAVLAALAAGHHAP